MMVFLLHGGHAFTWIAWHPEPTLIVGVVIAVGLYGVRATSATLAREQRPSLIRIVSFLSGVALVFIALGSPLDGGAERLFSLHMLQHVILTTWAPPLVLMGLTAEILEPLSMATTRVPDQQADSPCLTLLRMRPRALLPVSVECGLRLD